MSKLWDYYGGEPFMENPRINPPLAIIGNPSRRISKMRNPLKYKRRLGRSRYEYDYVKKGKKAMAKRVSRKHRSSGKKRKSHRKGRQNAFPMAGVVANPRVIVISKGRKNRKSYRKGRKNPAFLSGLSLPPLNQVLYAGAGFIAPPMVEGFINRFLPVSVTSTTIGRYATKIASVIALTFLAKKAIGPSEARMVALGGTSYVLVSAVNEFLPQLTMSAYRSGMINRYRNGGVNAYHSGTINGYAMPQLSRNLPSLAAPIWGARNAAAIDGTGGVGVIAQRFRRFQ